MGKRKTKSKTPKRRGAKKGRPEKTRKLTSDGRIKKKRGDLKMVSSKMVGFKTKQKKGGKTVRASEQRVCRIHTKCNCVVRTDPGAMSYIYNR